MPSWYSEQPPGEVKNASPQAFALLAYGGRVARSDHGGCKDVKNDVRPDAQRKDCGTADHENPRADDDTGADGHGVRRISRQLHWRHASVAFWISPTQNSKAVGIEQPAALPYRPRRCAVGVILENAPSGLVEPSVPISAADAPVLPRPKHSAIPDTRVDLSQTEQTREESGFLSVFKRRVKWMKTVLLAHEPNSPGDTKTFGRCPLVARTQQPVMPTIAVLSNLARNAFTDALGS
jgi:hypothetical protein